MNRRYLYVIVTVTICFFSLAEAIDIKDVPMKIANFGKVVFSHNLHFRQEGIKNNCKACHNAIFNLRGKKTFTMADMEKGQSCGACHNGKRAFDLKNCIQCHKVADVYLKVKETGPVRFSHKPHLKGPNANNCGLCHPKLYDMAPKRPVVTMAQMEKGRSCGACHNGKAAFKTDDCTKCHPTKELEIKVKDAGDVKFSHDFHAGLYKCGDCHVKLYLPSTKNKRVSKDEMEKGKSCGACHIESKEAFTVKENCDRCHKM